MTLGQKAVNMIENLPDEKTVQVIQYAEFLAFHSKAEKKAEHNDVLCGEGEGYSEMNMVP